LADGAAVGDRLLVPGPGRRLDSVVVAEGVRTGDRTGRVPRQVLAGISLEVARGEFVAVMGPSGCGKSTLLHVLAGLEPPDQGRVLVQGQDLYALDDDRLAAVRRDHIGVVFQLFNLIPSLTAAENVALPLRLRGRDHGGGRRGTPSRRQVIRRRVDALMDQLDLHRVRDQGADEPTGNLDRPAAHEVMALLSRLCREEGQTTLVVTHDARTAAWADRVLVMRDGAVVDALSTGRRAHPEDGATPDPAPLLGRLVELGL
jgi:putative ABC transport system ATP-binding protein